MTEQRNWLNINDAETGTAKQDKCTNEEFCQAAVYEHKLQGIKLIMHDKSRL